MLPYWNTDKQNSFFSFSNVRGLSVNVILKPRCLSLCLSFIYTSVWVLLHQSWDVLLTLSGNRQFALCTSRGWYYSCWCCCYCYCYHHHYCQWVPKCLAWEDMTSAAEDCLCSTQREQRLWWETPDVRNVFCPGERQKYFLLGWERSRVLSKL